MEPNNVRGLLQEQLPPLTAHEALVESSRCLYCFDAPCANACPTHIDIAAFIRKISTGNLKGSARTILEANLLGATCARVCPVQELCEGACVLNAEEKPIPIGRLQRYATDHGGYVFPATTKTGARVAVIGAGPAGLCCAGELARRGHDVTIYEKRDLGGGLSTYGIIVLREPVPVALAEVDMIARMGVRIETGAPITSAALLSQFDAVFIGTGLDATQHLGIEGEERVIDGLQYIEQSKLSPNELPAARRVLVIGAGNTAIDCATVAKRNGADHVKIVYRRTEREMTAYRHEYDFARREGIEFEFLAQPVRFADDGLECVRMSLTEPDGSGRPAPTPIPGSNFILAADHVIKAIGQQKPGIAALFGLETEKGFIKVNSAMATSMPKVFAGGDCVRVKGAASTVMAVQDGKIAAAAIHEQVTPRG